LDNIFYHIFTIVCENK